MYKKRRITVYKWGIIHTTLIELIHDLHNFFKVFVSAKSDNNKKILVAFLPRFHFPQTEVRSTVVFVVIQLQNICDQDLELLLFPK